MSVGKAVVEGESKLEKFISRLLKSFTASSLVLPVMRLYNPEKVLVTEFLISPRNPLPRCRTRLLDFVCLRRTVLFLESFAFATRRLLLSLARRVFFGVRRLADNVRILI